MPSIEKGRSFPSQRQRILWIGREKRRLTSPHFIIFGKEREAMIVGSAAARTSPVGRPLAVFFSPTYSPRGVVMTSSFPTSAFCDLAKPKAAWVGEPSAAKATDLGGPMTTSSLSSCLEAKSPKTTSRRQVPWVSIERTAMELDRSSLSIFSLS